jgi:hypothetical protein
MGLLAENAMLGSQNFRTSKDGDLASFTTLYRIRTGITETL